MKTELVVEIMDLAHEERLSKVEERAKSNTHRLEELEKRQDNLDDLVSTVKVLAVREEQVETDVKEIKSDVKGFATKLDDLNSKDAAKWEARVEKAVMTVIGIIVGYLMTQIGF